MVWVVVEIAFCLFFVCMRKKIGFLGYQIAIAGAFLLALTFVQELDFTMSVYIFFAVLPYIRYFKSDGVWAGALLGWMVFESVLSILANGLMPVISALVIHYVGPLLVVYLYSRIPEEELVPTRYDSSRYIRVVLVAACFIETLVGAISLSLSPDGRLMLNYQCVSGCVASIAPLLCLVLAKRGEVAFPILVHTYLLFWVFMSGTRGYIVLAVVLSLLLFLQIRDFRNRVLLSVLVGLALCVVFVLVPDYVGSILDALRFGESTGRRTYENAWTLNMLAMQNPIYDLFGFGIGTTYGTRPDAVAAFAGTGVDDYAFRTVLANTTLHNFWYTMVLSIGVLGVILYLGTLVSWVMSLKSGYSKKTVLTVAIFFVAYAFVLWFRWTATGGIFESAVIAYYLATCKDGLCSMGNSKGARMSSEVNR